MLLLSTRPLDIWPTIKCLNGNTYVAESAFEWTIAGRSPCNTTEGFDCSQSSSHWVHSSKSSYDGEDMYEFTVTFNAPEEYSYEVVLNIRGLSSNPAVVKNLTAVSYIYAVHPPLDDQCNINPIDAVDAQGECTQDGTNCHCDFVALNASQCQALQCMRYYLNEVDPNSAWTDLGMSREVWSKRCHNAGCLFEAAMVPNSLTYIVEEGWWPSYNTGGTSPPFPRDQSATHWTPKQTTDVFSLTTEVDQIILNCSGILYPEQASSQTVIQVGDNCTSSETGVYWRPCNNITTEMTPIPDATPSNSPEFFRKANWNVVWSPGQQMDHGPRPATCATGRWSAAKHNDCQGFEYPFSVQFPGTYRLQTTLHNPSGIELKLPPVEVIVGPGRLDIYHSTLAMPAKPDPLVLPNKIRGRGCSSDNDVSTACRSDPLNQNPRSGPNVGGKGRKFQRSRIVYDYSLSMKDAMDNPRDGSDQMLVRIKLVGKNSPFLQSSALAQESLPESSYVKCFATEGIRNSLARSGLMPECGTIPVGQTIEVGGVCNEDTAGEYTFRNEMEPTVSNALYGVFQLDVWLCPSTQLSSSTDLSMCLQELNHDPGSQIGPSTQGLCKQSPTPTDPSCRRAMGQPLYFSYGSNAQHLERKPMPMIFTVCPPNSDTSTGRWNDPPGTEGSGFVQGPQLHTCTCNAGYMGHKGHSCEGCRVGKFTSQSGSPECSDCDVGKHCACTTGYCGPDDAFPACKSCELCDIGKYQATPGQEACAECKEGFNCQEMGMTYPVAYAGHYISATNPEETTTCADGWGASRLKSSEDGEATLSMSSDLPSYPPEHIYRPSKDPNSPPHLVVAPEQMSLQQWVQADEENKDRTTGDFANERGKSCPGGNMSLAKELRCIFDDDSQKLVSSVDEQQSDKCRLAVGSLCLEGYRGEKAAACQTCDANWYHDSATGQCYPCVNTNGKVLAAAVTILALVLAPFILKFAEGLKHAGALQAPIMSLVNFFQSADLFKGLDLHWPPGFLAFVHSIASVFNFSLPKLPFLTKIRPECAFSMSFSQKWMLEMLSPFLLWTILWLFVVFRICVSFICVQLLGRYYVIPAYTKRMLKVTLPRVHFSVKQDRLEATRENSLSSPLISSPKMDELRRFSVVRLGLTSRLDIFRQALIPTTVLALDVLFYYVLISNPLPGRAWAHRGDMLWIIWVITSVLLMFAFALWFLSRRRTGSAACRRCAAVELAMVCAERCICGGKADTTDDPLGDKQQRHTISPELQAPVPGRQEINEGAGWLRSSAILNADEFCKFRLIIMAGDDCFSPVPRETLNGSTSVTVNIEAKNLSQLLQGIAEKLHLQRDVVLCEKDEDTNAFATYDEDFDFRQLPRAGKFHLRWKDEPEQPPTLGFEHDSELVLRADSVVEPPSGMQLDTHAQQDSNDIEMWLEEREGNRTAVGGLVYALLGMIVALMACECGVIDWQLYNTWFEQRFGPSSHISYDELTRAFVSILCGCTTGFLGSRSERKFVERLIKLASFDQSAQADARAKVRYILLVFCQVGYVFLVSSSLEPLTCTKDVDKKWYMAANPVL